MRSEASACGESLRRRVMAAVVALADVTDRKEGEKERELFLGALGHDLRNPLQVISVAAESLSRRADLPETAIGPATRIASSAERMNRLIGELLDFAGSQHGAIQLNPEWCRLAEVAQEVVQEISVVHPSQSIQIKALGGCDGCWDRSRIAQVFQNLVWNAVEHGVPDHPIEVTTGYQDGSVWARVTNRGRGIPPQEQARIFEPFRAGAKSRGLRLGLYIARAIVEAHGGKIGVEIGR